MASKQFQGAESIQFYLSMRDEVSTGFLIDTAQRLKKRIVVPLLGSESELLTFSELRSMEPETLEEGPFGVIQPRRPFQKKVMVKEIDLWVIPGIAFDKKGNRLGYGGGYYDRILYQHQKPVIGLAFDIQLVPQLPAEPTDVPVDFIMTETQTIVCREDECESSKN